MNEDYSISLGDQVTAVLDLHADGTGKIRTCCESENLTREELIALRKTLNERLSDA